MFAGSAGAAAGFAMVGTELVKTHGRFKIYFVGDGGIAAGPHARRTIGARRAGRGGCDRHHPVAGQCPERTVHCPDDFARVAREMRGPRDMVPIKPDRGAWDRTATAAGQQALTFIEYHTMFDVDGTQRRGVAQRDGRRAGPPARLMTLREEIEARYTNPRAELGDDYDPDLDGPLSA